MLQTHLTSPPPRLLLPASTVLQDSAFGRDWVWHRPQSLGVAFGIEERQREPRGSVVRVVARRGGGLGGCRRRVRRFGPWWVQGDGHRYSPTL